MKHIIFEGAELAGKSWIMSQIYNHLEPKGRQSKNILDGCHWFNADNGVFGTPESEGVLKGYIEIFKALKNKNIIVEKFSLSDKIYHRIHNAKEKDYSFFDNELKGLDFKIVLITFKEDESLLEKRIQDRLNLYPHYKDILHKPSWYIAQQQEYRKEIEKCGVPFLVVETDQLPDERVVKEIINWI